MALRTDRAVEVFSAVCTGKLNNKEIEVAEARSVIQELAKNPNPNNRYEIAQIMAFSVDDLLKVNTDWMNTVGEVKDVGIGEKAVFKIKNPGIRAYIQAKGATTSRSKILNKYVSIDTDEVSCRPYVSYLELAAGKVNFDENIADAAYAMEIAKIQKIESVLRASFGTYSTPAFAAGSGLVKATLDSQIDAFSRLGRVTLLGDIAIISKLADLTGFQATTTQKQFSDSVIDEQNRNGFIGTYRASNVVKMTNPYVQGSITSTTLKKNLLHILPTGMDKVLKIVNEGPVSSQDQTNIDDGSYEVQLRQNFGAAVVTGNIVTMGVYEDTTI